MEVVRAVTSTPARAIGFDHCIGALTKGYLADITILQKHDCNSLVEDCQGQKRFMKETIRAVKELQNVRGVAQECIQGNCMEYG